MAGFVEVAKGRRPALLHWDEAWQQGSGRRLAEPPDDQEMRRKGRSAAAAGGSTTLRDRPFRQCNSAVRTGTHPSDGTTFPTGSRHAQVRRPVAAPLGSSLTGGGPGRAPGGVRCGA